MKHSVYSEILASMGWFDTGMDKPEPFFGDYRILHPQPRGAGEILPDTLIAYYPGCFAEFHTGHMAVIRETVKAMKAVTDDYRVIIAPANSDYTMSKYGDVVQASNKYRYDKIMNWLRGAMGMERVHIDLNPMLNFDRDHNFPDLIDDFLKGQGLSLDVMERAPYVVCGKDRDWSNLRRATNRIRVFYSQGDSTSSSAIMAAKEPTPRIKKDLILRCTTWYDFDLFVNHFGDQYKSVKPLYKSHEMDMARALCEKHKFDFTICKEYHSLLPYHQVSRKWHNPLDQSGEFYQRNLPDMDGKLILDSDVFSGSTRDFVESRGGKLIATFEVDPVATEVVDYDDMIYNYLQYPHADVAWRCSMAPFTKESHANFAEFLKTANELC